jgi:hypothetical protein
MNAFNVVRFRVKPGNEQQFIEEHRKARPKLKGLIGASLIKTGEQTFCFIGEWRAFRNIVDARPEMIGMLDRFRDLLEDLGGGLGLTDPVSGEVVTRITGQKTPKKKTARRKTARKTAPARRPSKRAKAKRKR